MATIIATSSQRWISIMMRSELLVEHVGDLVLELVPEGALAPGAGVEPLAALEVGLEGGRELRRDFADRSGPRSPRR